VDGTGGSTLQRLFSTFPGGKPGGGLLLLRVAAGITAMRMGIFYFSAAAGASVASWSLGFVLIASGAALTIGFLTPFAALLAGLCFLGIAAGWLPAASWALSDARVVAVAVIVTSSAIALLGPGAFSLDGRLFGRREIVIPPAARPPEEP
jgi:uncharacterized membrane protein YphA (DoxX/SURF4 family)